VIAMPVKGSALATSVVATASVAGVTAIGAATAAALIVETAEAVSPAVSWIVAVTVVVTALPGAPCSGVGVKTRPSSAAATVVDSPETLQTPFRMVLPSVATLGSDSTPLPGEPSVTVAVSVCSGLGSVMTMPANGSAVAASVVAIVTVAGVIEIGTAPPVVIVEVVDAVSPVSAMTALTVVVTA
jgi:hypothetical protein